MRDALNVDGPRAWRSDPGQAGACFRSGRGQTVLVVHSQGIVRTLALRCENTGSRRLQPILISRLYVELQDSPSHPLFLDGAEQPFVQRLLQLAQAALSVAVQRPVFSHADVVAAITVDCLSLRCSRGVDQSIWVSRLGLESLKRFAATLWEAARKPMLTGIGVGSATCCRGVRLANEWLQAPRVR